MNDNIQQEFLDYCESGDINKAKKLLNDSRVDPSYKDNWVIRWSSMYGHIDVVRHLLKDSRVDKHMLLNSNISDRLRKEVLEYLNDVRYESINKVLDIDI